MRCLVSFIFIFLICVSQSEAEPSMLTRKDALIRAEITEEVRELYSLYNGRLVNCIEKSVLKSCDSDWVTCIDDAWVVQFIVGEQCPVVHDGRLSVTFVIDAVTGKIISRFPEKEYFQDPHYCLDNHDCLWISPENGQKCQNFIYGQISQTEVSLDDLCVCLKNQCILR